MQIVTTSAAAALTAMLLAGTASPAHAAPACTVEALNALHVPNVNVTQATPTPPAAACRRIARCRAPWPRMARARPTARRAFAIQLPDAWQQRFFSMGVGGNAGTLTPAVNATDRAAALGKGYVTIVTDTGHTGNGTDANWVRTPDGKRDDGQDHRFLLSRGTRRHRRRQAIRAGLYAAPVQHAYFDGCSNGGRMAMMEADRYPDRLRRHHRRRSRHGLPFGAAALRGAEGGAVLACRLPVAGNAVMRSTRASPRAATRSTARRTGWCKTRRACPIQAEDLICHAGADRRLPDAGTGARAARLHHAAA